MAVDHPLRVRLSRIDGETPRGVLRNPLFLPATLGNFAVTEEAQHTIYETVSAGQFSQPSLGPSSARSLRTLDEVDTLAMTWTPEWLHDQVHSPEFIKRQIRAVLRSRRPVELLAKFKNTSGTPFLRMNVVFVAETRELRGGEADTVYYTIRMQEWRNATGKRKGAGKGSQPRIHVLKAGETLHSIALDEYHTAGAADNIAKANGIRKWGFGTALAKHPRFKVGDKIKLPALGPNDGNNGGARAPSFSGVAKGVGGAQAPPPYDVGGAQAPDEDE